MIAYVEKIPEELGVFATLPLPVKNLEDISQYLQLREMRL